MTSIPASEIVSSTPSVLPTGGDAIDIVGLVLTTNTRVPIGTVQTFDSPTEVNSFFGPASHQAKFAAIYFAGFKGASVLPGSILYAQYPINPVSAYLRGGNISALSSTALQAFNGSLSVTIDGNVKSASINLSAATSQSNAAEIIGAALGIEGVQAATFTGSISGTVLTVASGLTGTVSPGDVLNGSGVTANTYILNQLTGPAGGLGTYTVSPSQTVGSEALTADTPGVQYDSVSGAFLILSGTTGATSTITDASGALATDLLLTAATGAVLSQGAAAATPGGFMNSLTALNSAFVTFTTDFDPDAGSGNTQKQAFAAWNTDQDDDYAYVCWDTDVTPTTELPAPSSLGQILAGNGNSGTSLNWESGDQFLAAFVMGAAASIDFDEPSGRITFAGKMQSGLVAGVSTDVAAENLGGNPQQPGSNGNFYNFYGDYAQASNQFIWYQRGTVTGPFGFLDSYINQIWLRQNMDNALLNLIANTKSIPFGAVGTTRIEQALADPIAQGLSFGAFGPGSLTASQIASVNAAAGAPVAPIIASQGSYLQVAPASGAVETSRGPVQVNFWYLDNGSIQSISLNTIAVVG